MSKIEGTPRYPSRCAFLFSDQVREVSLIGHATRVATEPDRWSVVRAE